MERGQPKSDGGKTPFGRELENREIGVRVFKTTPGLRGKRIIRRSEILQSGEKEKRNKHEYKDFLAARKEFGLLRDEYGIAVPKFQLVRQTVRRNGKTVQDSMFTVVDEIEGDNLKQVDTLPAGSAPKFNRFFEGLSRYFVDAYKNKKRYLMDIFARRQYKYGKKPGDTEDEIYLVDLDPYMRNAGSLKDLGYMIEDLRELVLPWIFDLEQMFLGQGDLRDARDKTVSSIEYLERERERLLKSENVRKPSR